MVMWLRVTQSPGGAVTVTVGDDDGQSHRLAGPPQEDTDTLLARRWLDTDDVEVLSVLVDQALVERERTAHSW